MYITPANYTQDTIMSPVVGIVTISTEIGKDRCGVFKTHEVRESAVYKEFRKYLGSLR